MVSGKGEPGTLSTGTSLGASGVFPRQQDDRGGSRLLWRNYRGTNPLIVTLCRGSASVAIRVFFGLGHGPELLRVVAIKGLG